MPRHPPNALKTLDRSHYHHAPTAVQHVDPIFVVLRSVDHQTDKSERRSKRSINYSVNLPAWTRGGLAFPDGTIKRQAKGKPNDAADARIYHA